MDAHSVRFGESLEFGSWKKAHQQQGKRWETIRCVLFEIKCFSMTLTFDGGANSPSIAPSKNQALVGQIKLRAA